MNFHLSSRNIRLGAWFPAVAIIAWIILAAMLNTSQFNDNIEQFVWSHSIEWGYWKHPPLPTFLFALLSHLIGPSIHTAYIMAALCLSVTAFFTWKIAECLLGKHWGTVAILLLGLQLGFSWRAQIYNHNTVLIMMVAATVWVSMLAAEQKRLLLWLCAGTLAGLAMLAKYQALVPLLALLGALWKTGALKIVRNRLGLIIALASTLIVFAPHLQWLISHDFLPLAYAKKTLHSTGAAERLHVLIAFLITEIRSLVPALVTLGVFALFFYQNNKNNKAATEPEITQTTPHAAEVKTWMIMLIGFPAVFVSSLALFGVHLEGHWVLQTFQFFPIWFAWRLKLSFPQLQLRSFLLSVVITHTIAMCFYVNSAFNTSARAALISSDRIYPATVLANHVLADWQKNTQCPLKYIVGPSFEAGMVSVYSKLFPAVLENGDPHKSPWINLADLQKRGAIYVDIDPTLFPKEVKLLGAMNTPGRGPERTSYNKIYWGIVLPREGCF